MLLAVGVSVGEPVCDRLPLFLFLDRQHGKVRRDQTTDAEPSGQGQKPHASKAKPPSAMASKAATH